MNDSEQDRQRYVSVAVAFGDLEALERHGSSAAELTCPECGAKGRRFGRRSDEWRLEGFEAKTRGGLGFILARCHGCDEEVTLPHA